MRAMLGGHFLGSGCRDLFFEGAGWSSEKLPELVVSQAGLLDDGVEGSPFEVVVVIGEGDTASWIVRVLEDDVRACRVMNEKACPLRYVSITLRHFGE